MDTLNTLFASINYRDPVWIAVAYLCGFLIWQIKLPSMVGYLLAGFILSVSGATGGEFLDEMADLGVTLLLFTIGLKLNIKQLLRPEIWAVTTIHMALITVITAFVLVLLAAVKIPIFSQMSTQSILIVSFALSFSSTVFAVKVFEDKGGMASQYGRIAIGVLIMQDIAAVIFLSISTAKIPSVWAAVMIGVLVLSKPILIFLLKRAGHGELLILYGLVLALGGSSLFELVSLKGDLGALFFGLLLAQHPKSGELAKSLLSLKELFLVGFFLSIGISVVITQETLLITLFLLLIIPIKVILFNTLFMRFKVRARPSTLASFSLGNFSEFGLIVTAISVNNQWLDPQWLAIMAMAVVGSFVIASPLNVFNTNIYDLMPEFLQKFEHKQRLPGEDLIVLKNTRVLICGMGRIGVGAYDQMHLKYDGNIIGIDFDDACEEHDKAGLRNTIRGDATSPDFWRRVKIENVDLSLVMLCMPNYKSNVNAAIALREWGYKGEIAAVTKYKDEEQELHQNGVDITFNIYAEIGTGFAQHVLQQNAQSEDAADLISEYASETIAEKN
ncbi:cation:proton antiporter [Cocleimonas sp. KMM 6892]|uniref:cation:proton antiporter family protein n=1 Tax=unclassified Cocleimonas TaxID=2639732 RepID=UPI002DC03927|nr:MULTISPECIES: cation:proton antiporter family protein [unclassified Cocleimonas]MEB8434216.1 cation:proton antiporter [Cocleimonas sp. KMM 6892]MEC4717165.1 cation:proton antiporter [Cocleimonas sp. KMM 6895]MEC4746488.1 cation:proton antiporter [Cocleimonas sp. KMM 6896]